MRLYRSTAEWAIDAPAKLNLFFEVLAKRPDGFHEIETLMCPIDLYDTLYFRETADEALTLQCEMRVAPQAGTFAPRFPQGRDNIVFRAVELLRQRAGVTVGAALRLVKRIPVEAGLGGGSSDAAAALCVANRAWNLGWTVPQLAALAAELGSDVPFFLAGGPALCRGRGERVEPVGGLGALHFVVVRPPEGLSTALVYGHCRPTEKPCGSGAMVAALRCGDVAAAGRGLVNRLEAAAEQLSPWIGRLRDTFGELDLLGHRMSGSGTAYFGLCRHAGHARRMAKRLAARGFVNVFAVRSCL